MSVASRCSALLGLVLAAGLLSGCASSHSASANASAACASALGRLAPVTNRGNAVAKGTSVEVDGANASFDPTCVTDIPRGVVMLTVRNTGQVLHNVDIAAQHIDVDIARGRSVTVRVRVGDQPVVFTCKYHRSLGMIGVLIPAAAK